MSKYWRAGLSKRRYSYADADDWADTKEFLTRRKFDLLREGKNPYDDPDEARKRGLRGSDYPADGTSNDDFE